jgi:ribosomal protein S18 acetylase RimI-like enzyme
MTEAGHHFAAVYNEARAAFLHACAVAGGAIVSHRHPLSGPTGESLFLDEARFGRSDARRVLFIACGTHGIEGYCGSGIQVSLLRTGLATRLPEGVALVLLHAVNPWGFAWGRRVNEDNVDINRNFLDHAAAHPENPDYDRLDPILNPAQLEEENVSEFLTALQRFQDERGIEAVYRSLSGGQYRHPSGVQFGGCSPVWSNRTLRALWARHAGSAELAVYVDLHSGLGPRAVGLVMQTASEASMAGRLAREWWPDVVRGEPAQGSDAALASGLIGPAFVAALEPAAAVGVVLEFGTLDMTTVMLAVQADNWLQHHGQRDSDTGRRIAQRMRDAFFIDADDWKDAVCARAREVVDRCLEGITAFAPETSAVPRLRTAVPSDADVLVDFARAMARETEDRDLDPAVLRPGMVALLADESRGRVFVVEEGGTVVATLTLTMEWSDWRNGWFWWIQSVYVTPAHRRRGHYRRLHDHVVALAARDPEVCGIRLYVEHENHAAQATYRALGMSETAYRLYEQPTRRS